MSPRLTKVPALKKRKGTGEEKGGSKEGREQASEQGRDF